MWRTRPQVVIMDIFVWIILALALIGGVLAFVEWRRGRVFLEHDQNLDASPETEADRQLMRTTSEMRGRDASTGRLD